MRTAKTLEQEVAAIGDLSRDELVQRWIATYGCSPPKGIKRGLLERSAAWHLQARHLGGLSSASRGVLRSARHADAEALRPISIPDVTGSDLAAAPEATEPLPMEGQAGQPHARQRAEVPQTPHETRFWYRLEPGL